MFLAIQFFSSLLSKVPTHMIVFVKLGKHILCKSTVAPPLSINYIVTLVKGNVSSCAMFYPAI